MEEKAEIAAKIADVLADATDTKLDDEIAQFVLRLLDDPFVEKMFDEWFDEKELEESEEKEDGNDFPVLDSGEEEEED